MIDFLKKIFIAEFDGNGKERGSFFGYQFLLILSILIFSGIIFFTGDILRSVDMNFLPHCGKYCNKDEVKLGRLLEIGNNIFMIFSLLFLLRFNGGLIDRFSFFRFTGKIESFFEIILTLLKLSIIGLIIFFSINFFLYFSGENFVYIYNIINFKEELIIFILQIIFVSEFFLFLLGLILSRKKNI